MAKKLKQITQRKISHKTYFTQEERKILRLLTELALEEDIGNGDITTNSIVSPKQDAIAYLRSKEPGIICGLPLIDILLKQKTKKYKIRYSVKEGDIIRRNQVIAEIAAPAGILLMIERVLLNFLQRLSGIATLTRRYVQEVEKYSVRIKDTRKTTPMIRILEKYAVVVGGGYNHRFGLFDRILIKDNHIEIAGGIENAVRLVRRKYPGLFIEVEAKTLKQVQQILSFQPDVILLDNMTIKQLRQAVKIVQGKAKLEASGNISLKNVERIASIGIDFISIGALTHSATALDMSLKMVPLLKGKKK